MTSRGGAIGKRSGRGSRGERDQGGGESRSDRFVHENATGSHAGLPVVHDQPGPGDLGRKDRIRVFEHDHGIAAGKFEGRGDQPFGACDGDMSPHAGRTGERDMIELCLLQEGRSGRPLRRPHLEFEFIEPRMARQLQQSGLGPRGSFAGLHDHSVPGHHRLHQLNSEQLDRVVPGRDDPNPAVRHPGDPQGLSRQPPRAIPQSAIRENPARPAGVPATRGDRRQDLGRDRLPGRLADLLFREPREFGGVRRNQPAERPRPLEAFPGPRRTHSGGSRPDRPSTLLNGWRHRIHGSLGDDHLARFGFLVRVRHVRVHLNRSRAVSEAEPDRIR